MKTKSRFVFYRYTIPFVLSFVFLFSNKTAAQIFPPDFLCVRSDSLFWEIPTNTCGTFNSYEIYFSNNPTSGFTLLSTVTNQGQNFFHHPNPSGDTWYYYMQSDFINCPGQMVLQSDTLNNEQPEVAIIQRASVNGNTVELEWLPSSSPEASAYIIFRNTSMGTVPLDTVFTGTTYIDFNALPNVQSETYFIIALDDCGNTSIFNDPHSTIHLSQTVAGCEQTINLNWNLYEGWEIGSQEIWVSVDGNPSMLAGTVDATDTTFVFENANDSETYCFSVKAIESGNGNEVFSNEVCLTPDLVQPMRNLILKNVNVLPNNSVELTWNWDSNAEIQSVEILRSDNSNTFTFLESSSAPVPLGSGSRATDITATPSVAKVFYKIQTTDDCDTLAFSNYGSTIHLTGSAQNGPSNFITWTDFDIENVDLLDYDIYRVVGGDVTFLENVSASTTSYSDPVDAEKEEESNVCYYVVANTEVTLPNGSIQRFESTSNITCVEQISRIVAPNAFAPQGINQIFKPVVVFGETAAYEFQVYNRWGELLFETRNRNQGWNGKYKGKIQPMGAYVFHVKITQQSGRVVEEKGVFTLLR